MQSDEIVAEDALVVALDTARSVQEQSLALIASLEKRVQGAGAGLAPEVQLELAELRKLLSAKTSHLRGLTRNAIFQVRKTKADTAEARSEIDTLHLNLQNLYYEQRHLRGEIFGCESYDHKYRQLPLIPADQFLEEKPEFHDADEHSLMVARIEHELHEREALEASRQEMLKKKQSLIAENKKRKEDLASLDNDLEKFIDAAKPIQKLFEKEY